MPVEIHEFELSPAPAPALAPPAPGAATAAPPAEPAPDLEHLARARRVAAAVCELQLRTFAH